VAPGGGTASSTITTAGARANTAGSYVSHAALITPVAGGAIAAVIGVGVYGVCNWIAYAKKYKTGTQAILDTTRNAGGLGVAAGLGIWAANIVAGTGLALASPVVLPFATALAVTYVSKRMWDLVTTKNAHC